MIRFLEQGHVYESIIPDGVKWLGVTTLVSNLHEKFNAEEQAPKSSARKPTPQYPNKWYGLPVVEILKAWNSEGERSTELGHQYHAMREQELYNFVEFPVIQPVMEDGAKIAPPQTLTEGIYPEHLVYMHSAGICGQSDRVDVREGRVYIRDYKTSKKIDRKGFSNYKGTKMMLPPVAHLEDCHISHYALQLSIYMYIILRHNPSLLPGKMIIEHVKFEIASEDKYGYPIYKRNEYGDFIVKEIEEIEVPYLKAEVQNILNWLKTNRTKIQTK